VLLVGAGLLVRSWWSREQRRSGIQARASPCHGAVSPTNLSVPAQRIDLYHRTLEQIEAVPGVEDAGIIGDLFIANNREQSLTVERTTARCPSVCGCAETK
jgi:hypothetical protein